MKKTILTLVMAGILLTGCQEDLEKETISEDKSNTTDSVVLVENTSSESPSVQVDSNEIDSNEIDSSEIAYDIKALLIEEGYDPQDPVTTLDYINTVKTSVGKDKMDLMVIYIIDLIEGLDTLEYEAKASSYFEAFLTDQDILDDESFQALYDQNSTFHAFADRLKAKGLKIDYSVHWQPSVETSYENLNEMFSDYVSPEMADYLNILESESVQHYIGSSYDDLIRGISLDELVSRILATEDFLEKHPHSKRVDLVQKYNSEYLYEYLYGHTKYDTSFDWMSEFELKEDFRIHYEKTVQENEGSDLADLIKKFLKNVDDNQGLVDGSHRLIESPKYILNKYIGIPL